jgi:hypothetical protein
MSTDTFDERVAVIVGSTRPTRICPGIAEWTQRTLSEQSPLRCRSIDLAEINLPMLDEPLKAALQDYSRPPLRRRLRMHCTVQTRLPAGLASRRAEVAQSRQPPRHQGKSRSEPSQPGGLSCVPTDVPTEINGEMSTSWETSSRN